MGAKEPTELTGLECTLGEALITEELAEGMSELKGKMRIVLEGGLRLYREEDVFEDVLRFKGRPARGGCICGCICGCGCRCGSGCLVGVPAVAVGTTREV